MTDAILDKNEPSRFLGEGVFFKAKLIGILEVAEARGDRMCQEALADLKMAIRAAGEHKQRISVHVAIDGLRLRDEKTGDSLYHHPVHKISFIAQDMSDSRAFGYIFGSPDTGHRFFGIKTDKAASQVVIAMRDLFQVVFELKKKEIELAKQQLEAKTISSTSRYISATTLDSSKSQNGEGSSSSSSRMRALMSGGAGGAAGAAGSSSSAGGAAVAELVDLEQELSSLQRGLHQMERLTPPTDPFGDSFANTPGFLPPPPSSARAPRTTVSLTSEGSSPFSPPPARTHFTFESSAPSTSTTSTVVPSIPKSFPTNQTGFLTNQSAATTSVTSTSSILSSTNQSLSLVTNKSTSSVAQGAPASPVPTRHQSPRRSSGLDRGSVERSSIDKTSVGILDRSASVISPPPAENNTMNPLETSLSGIFDVFTELDPLGTGRSKPYVDKKHFFQELKNPPKKVLKDLAGGIPIPQPDTSFQPKFDTSPKSESTTTLTSVGRHSGGSVSISKPQAAFSTSNLFSTDPFAETDPFDNTDPFAESLKDDPFVGSSLDFSSRTFQSDYGGSSKLIMRETTLPETRIGSDEPVKIKFPSSLQNETPLQVSLPPETSSRSPRSQRQSSTDIKSSSIRQRPQSGKQAQPSPSPPPPLPPKKPVERVSTESSVGPPLPLPARRRPTPANSGPSWLGSNLLETPTAAEDDYLTPTAPSLPRRPVPSPAPSPGLDITLAQLLTCGMDELAGRLRMPAEKLSRMTIAQLTGHLREYLQTGPEEQKADEPPAVAERPLHTLEKSAEFEANFEDNFSASTATGSDTFVANFDNFNKKSYDRYAVFREIEVEGFKSPVSELLGQNQDEHDSLSSQPELPRDPTPAQINESAKILSDIKFEPMGLSNNAVKTTPSLAPNAKLEELKSVISNLHKSSLSPTPDIDITAASDSKNEDIEVKKATSNSDRYAALRDLSTVDETSRPLSADVTSETEMKSPLQVPKERKRSDEKSDFDHSDFFDCIDNSLSLAQAEEAFRKSPMIVKESLLSPEKPVETLRPSPARSPLTLAAPAALVSGSISDIASGSSPEIVLTGGRESKTSDRTVDRDRDTSRRSSNSSRNRSSATVQSAGDAWALLGRAQGPPPARQRAPVPPSDDGASPWSSDSKDSPPQPPRKEWQRGFGEQGPQRRHRRSTKSWQTRQTSSSSRDVSPWEEEPPPSRSYHRERRESGGSCERRDSGGSRDRHRRRHHASRDEDEWSEERGYSSRRISPLGGRSSSRELRPRDREPHTHAHSHRDRGARTDWAETERWRPDERGYSTVGRREGGRRRGEPPWQGEDPHRYSSTTMGSRSWRRSGSSGGGSSGGERPRRHQPSHRPARHRPRDPSPPPPANPRHHFFEEFQPSETESPIATKNNGARYRFSNDFSEKDSPKSHNSPFENDFVVDPPQKKSSKYDLNTSYASLDKESPVSGRMANFGRFKYDVEKELSSENLSGSPASPRLRQTSPQATVSRMLFEDDFSPEPRNGILRASDANGEHTRTETIHEGQELQMGPKNEERTEKIVGFDFGSGKETLPETRRSQKGNKSRTKTEMDIKKSESVNIFARESDPFDGDDFFNNSDKPKRDNWQGDFSNFENM